MDDLEVYGTRDDWEERHPTSRHMEPKTSPVFPNPFDEFQRKIYEAWANSDTPLIVTPQYHRGNMKRMLMRNEILHELLSDSFKTLGNAATDSIGIMGELRTMMNRRQLQADDGGAALLTALRSVRTEGCRGENGALTGKQLGSGRGDSRMEALKIGTDD